MKLYLFVQLNDREDNNILTRAVCGPWPSVIYIFFMT